VQLSRVRAQHTLTHTHIHMHASHPDTHTCNTHPPTHTKHMRGYMAEFHCTALHERTLMYAAQV